ncbi:hypothetical protein D3C80_1697500 [compost metagenome]
MPIKPTPKNSLELTALMTHARIVVRAARKVLDQRDDNASAIAQIISIQLFHGLFRGTDHSRDVHRDTTSQLKDQVFVFGCEGSCVEVAEVVRVIGVEVAATQ